MGKQTDAHITGVTDALQKLQTSINRVNTCKVAIDSAWHNMMAGYDKGGRAGSAPFAGALQTAVGNYDAAVIATKSHMANATTALNGFNTFVVAKDRGTINPLAKKSIGKAKKFVQTQKAVLDNLSKEVNGLADLSFILPAAKKHYI